MRKVMIYFAAVITFLIIFSACAKINFDGSSTGNSDRFILDYNMLNGSKIHKMTVNEGENIKVDIQCISGRTDVLVADSDDRVIYKADDSFSNEFTLRISKTSEYTFTVSGKRAKGSVSFVVNRQ